MNQPDQPNPAQSRTAPAASQPVAVNLEGVVKKYDNTTVLHEISLKVMEGEFLTLLGPSGCGKTTMLNLIAGFAQADNGEIFIGRELVTQTPPYQREIGIVFQNYALFPHMNVARNIGYGLRMRGVPKAEIAERVEQAMQMVKLGGYGERKPRELSGGQQQRVALARALVINPKVLLLDEPFSALDKSLRGSMQVEIKEIQRKLGVTTIFVTHDQGEALSMSDRIAVMSQGRICQLADPDTIYRSPTDPFVASFLGDVNILPVHYHGEDRSMAQVRLGTSVLNMPRERVHGSKSYGALLDLYVRPENIVLEPLHTGSILTGTVVRHVFQGDHVDSYVDVASVGNKHLLVRSSGLNVLRDWPVGAVVGLALPPSDVTAFVAKECSAKPNASNFPAP